MAKSSVIIVPITVVIVLISSFLNLIFPLCCICSPIVASVLGLIAGGLCVHLEKPTDAEKAVVRGGLAGAIAGLAALAAQTIGGTIAMIVSSAGQTVVACLPLLCNESSTASSQASWILDSFFTSCFCGLMLLAIMAGLGALSGLVWFHFTKSKAGGPPSGLGLQPRA